MGCGSSMTAEEKQEVAKQRALNKKIEAEQNKSLQHDQEIKKLLLLGAGESGKSTLFKQMVALYGKGYSEQERQSYRSVIFQNTISAIKTLLTAIDEIGTEIEAKLEDDNKEAAQRLNKLLGDEMITPQIAEDIKALWKDTGVQKTFDNRSKFQFPDSGPYFIEKVDELLVEGYIPSEQDVLRSRVRTTGIVETTFEIEGNQFRMFDVGGQRNERKKWIHCFENVTCVIFVAAISEFDQVLFEDETTNRVVEALNLFDEICNSSWFTKTSVILFLNKRDMFMEKIRKIPLNKWFPDYDGPAHDYDAGCEFFRQKFEVRNHCQDKEVYTHVTCATDSNNIAHVFESVKDILIKQSLRDAELF
jgi:guanine nucleotide-binding protein subunit alpha